MKIRKIIKYFFEFVFIFVFFLIFKILGYKLASNLGAKISINLLILDQLNLSNIIKSLKEL